MIDLAREVTGPEGVSGGLRRIHPALAEVLVEKVFEGAQRELAFFRSSSKGYGESLYATLTDLAEANLSPGILRKLIRKISGPDAARCRDLGVLAEGFRREMQSLGFYDGSSLLQMACEKMEAESPRVPTVFYGFAEMNALQRRLAAAACREAQSQALVPAQIGAPACRHAEPLVRWFEEAGFRREDAGPPAPRPLSRLAGALFSGDAAGSLAKDALRIVAASSRGREAWEGCREMLRAREDFEGDDEICVLMSERSGYQDLFEETFRALEIPCRTEEKTPLSTAPAARLFLLMLGLPMRDYPRAEVIRFLDEGGFTGSGAFLELTRKYEIEERIDGLPLASEWEFFSRSLPYLRGVDPWLAALDSALEEMGEEDEEYPAAYSLAMAMSDFFEHLEKIPEQGLPSSFVKSALEVFSETTSGLAHQDEVENIVSTLAGMDAVAGELTRDAFHGLCERFLDKTARAKSEPGESGGGHLASLSSIQSARGLSFDAVVLSGLGEGLFPPTGAEDPLLPDSVREELNRAAEANLPDEGVDIPLKKSREGEARFQFWTILQSVRNRLILSATSAEDGRGDEAASFPSMFLHYLSDALGEAKDGAWGLFARSRSRTAAAALDAGAISETRVHLREYDLANILKQIHRPAPGSLSYMDDFSGFARRRSALSERWRREVLTEYDGMFTAPDLRELIRERIHSPARPVGTTRVEVFFGCPYRFINDRLHPRMEKRREPAPLFAMDGMLRGELTHRILEEFHRRLQAMNQPLRSLDASIARDALRAAIQEAMREEAEKVKNMETPPLLALPWGTLEGALYRRLWGYVEQKRAGDTGWLPVMLEERFGGRGSEPLRISLENGDISLSGRMDLLERNGEGEYRVVDFKTVGRMDLVPSRTTVLGGGASLQLHLYARHLRAGRGDGALPDDARVSGAYAYITEEEGATERVRSHEVMAEHMEGVDALLNHFLASVKEGSFFPTPSDGCRYCDYKALCGPDRAERAARKAQTPGMIRLQALRDETP